MHKASVLKGSDLQPLTSNDKPSETVHVFGQNLEERVVDDESPSITFNIVDSKQIPTNEDENDISAIKKRKFDAITGEEDEVTIYQGEFKLFVWDLGSSNWVEKGRGLLKLNDSMDDDKKRSRLIMRIGGTLRIILNVAIKKAYFRVLTYSKTNIRFTDSQTVWAASGSNANQLKDLLDERLRISAEQEVAESKPSVEEENESETRKKPKASDHGDHKDEVDSSAPATKKTKSDAGKDTNSMPETVEATDSDEDKTPSTTNSTSQEESSDASSTNSQKGVEKLPVTDDRTTAAENIESSSPAETATPEKSSTPTSEATTDDTKQSDETTTTTNVEAANDTTKEEKIKDESSKDI